MSGSSTTARILQASISPRGSSASSGPICGARPHLSRALARRTRRLPRCGRRFLHCCNGSARALLDAPCGDAGWIGRIKLDLDYTGIDIVPSLIEADRRRVAGGEFSGRFLVADVTRDALPRADVILCRDCLVHLSFDNIARVLARFADSGVRFLLVTTFPEWNTNRDCEDGDWRALNMERAPFSWPAPRALINERCDEGDCGWRDKSLGLWRLNELPDPVRFAADV